jgi:small subunit ribosomal protein S17
MPKKKEEVEETQAVGTDEPSVVDEVIETVSSAVSSVADVVASGASALVDAVTGSDDSIAKKKSSKRAERVGIVSSDKMTKTVVVRVDRLVKHPVYRKYVKRRKKFMAHDEMGAKVGDKVKIVETRPMSARKRWRVVEIIQKAEL